MSKHVIAVVILLHFFCFKINAQKILSCHVVGVSGQPLSLASIKLLNENINTLTDEQGNFQLKVKSGLIHLEVAYVGYKIKNLDIFTDTLKEKQLLITLELLSNTLRDVTVSGLKRKSAIATRSLVQIQDIPQSIVVMDQKVIKQQAAFDLTTITRNISGLNYTGNYSGGGSYEFFNARGFDLSNSQNYRWNGQMIWNLGDNYEDNIEQVEFLKGPTSILFGDVTPGGVLNFVSKKPLYDFATAINLKIGQWGLFRPSADVSGPLNTSKSLRFRLNSSYEQSNSFRDYVNERRWLIAPTVSWDITPAISICAEVMFRHSGSTDDAGLVSPDGTVKGLAKLSPHLFLGEPERRYLFDDQSYFLTTNWNVASHWHLRMVNFYGYTKNRPWGIWPGQPKPSGDLMRKQYGYYQALKNFSSSIDITGTFYTGSIKHNAVIGGDFQSTHFRYTDEGYLHFFDHFNIYEPVYGVTPNVLPPTTYLPFVSIIERAGFYAQDQLMFFKEKLHLLLGFRAGNTKQGNDYFQGHLIGTGYRGYKDDIINKFVFIPRIGLVYKPQKDLSLYASWSKGYEVNSPDIFSQNYQEFAHPPATISTQIELGSKASLLHSGLGVSLTLFRIDKHDPYGFTYLTDSAGNVNYDKYNVYYEGHHRSEGIELDIDGKLTKNLSVTAGAAYTKTKVIEDPGYASGNQLPNAPKYTGNCWLNYDAEGKLSGLSFGAGIFYKDKFFSFIDNDPSLVIPANYTIDVSAGYKWKGLGLQINVSNITNRVSYLNPWAYILYDVQPLRRAVVTLSYQFTKKKQ